MGDVRKGESFCGATSKCKTGVCSWGKKKELLAKRERRHSYEASSGRVTWHSHSVEELHEKALKKKKEIKLETCEKKQRGAA